MADDRRPPPKPFDAFISYSHRADRGLASALQAALQTLARPWYTRRALHVFRDQTTLSASPALWTSIERALAQSRFFILLASPPSAESEWVAREVDWWRSNRGSDTMLLVLTGGDLAWDPAARCFGDRSPLPANARDW